MHESRHARDRRLERRVPPEVVAITIRLCRMRRIRNANHYVLRRSDVARVAPHLRRLLAPWTGLIVIEEDGTILTQFTNPRPARYLDRKRRRTSIRSRRRRPRPT